MVTVLEEAHQLVGSLSIYGMLVLKDLGSTNYTEKMFILFEKVTLIGRAVNALRRHGTKEISKVARSLIRDWTTKVDEWLHVNSAVKEVHSSAKDQCPSGLLIEGITVAPLAPTLDETLQAFDGLDEEEFFSILPQDNTLGNFYINGELGLTEEEELQIDTISGRFDLSVSIREEDLQQQPLPLQETSNFVEYKQPLTDKNELAISDDSKQVKKKGYTTKLGNQFPFRRMPESNGNRKSKLKNFYSEKAFTKQRVSSQICNVQKLKQSSGGPGRRKEENVVMKLNVASNSQLKPKGSPKDRNAAKPEQRTEKPSCSKWPENVRISQTNEPQKVEGTRRKLHERYKKVEDVKKQHAIQILHVNHDRLNRGYKRHKHHHAQNEK